MNAKKGHSQSADNSQLLAHKSSPQGGHAFKLKAPYKPTGDQPQAIAELVKGFKEGNQCQTFTIWDNYFWTVRKNKKMFKGAFKWKKLLNGYKSIKK